MYNESAYLSDDNVRKRYHTSLRVERSSKKNCKVYFRKILKINMTLLYIYSDELQIGYND